MTTSQAATRQKIRTLTDRAAEDRDRDIATVAEIVRRRLPKAAAEWVVEWIEERAE